MSFDPARRSDTRQPSKSSALVHSNIRETAGTGKGWKVAGVCKRHIRCVNRPIIRVSPSLVIKSTVLLQHGQQVGRLWGAVRRRACSLHIPLISGYMRATLILLNVWRQNTPTRHRKQLYSRLLPCASAAPSTSEGSSGTKDQKTNIRKDFEETRSFSCLSNSPLAFTRFVGSAHHKRDSQDHRRSWKIDVSSHVSTASRMSSREQRASSFPFTPSLAAILQTTSGVFRSAALPSFIRVLQRRLTWTSVDSFPSIITLQEQATSSPLFPQFFHLPY